MLRSDLWVFVVPFHGEVSMKLPMLAGYVLPFQRFKLPQHQQAEGSPGPALAPQPGEQLQQYFSA